MTRLHDAVKASEAEKVKHLLQGGYAINDLDENGFSPLHYAVKNSNLDLVTLLLKKGADVNLGPYNAKPLNEAIKNNNLEIVKLIVFAKPDTSTKNYDDASSLLRIAQEKLPQSKDVYNFLLLTQVGTNLPIGQDWIMKRMQHLGYGVNDEGICHGIILMTLKAFLKKDSQSFEERLQLIAKLPEEKNAFLAEIAEISRQRWILTKEAKENNLQQLRKLTPSEELLIQEEKRMIDERLTLIAKELNLSEEEIAKRRKQMLFSAYTQQKINEKLNDLPRERRLKQEILNFFDSIVTYQQLEDKDHLYHSDISHYQDIVTSSNILGDNLRYVTSFSSVYTIPELTAYFESLAATVEKADKKTPIVFMLSSLSHTIFVGYDPVSKYFLYLNPTYMNVSRVVEHPSRMATLVQKAFDISPKITADTIVTTKIYSDDASNTTMQVFLNNWKHNEIWKSLHDAQKFKNLSPGARRTWMEKAIQINDVDTIQKLISIGETVTQHNLATAIEMSNTETLDAILATKINVNLIDTEDSPLWNAVLLGRLDVTERLLHVGANTNVINEKGLTPLLYAVSKKNHAMTKVLLEKADPNVPSEHGATPLMYAVEDGDYAMAELILTKADPNTVIGGLCAIDLAIYKKDIEMITLLRNKGATLSTDNIAALIQILTELEEQIRIRMVTRDEFRQAWRIAFPPDIVDSYKVLNDPAFPTYRQISEAADDESIQTSIQEFMAKFPNHRLTKELKEIIDAKKNKPMPHNP